MAENQEQSQRNEASQQGSSSDGTLNESNTKEQDQTAKKEQSGGQGEEEKGQQAPPPPIDFWDSRLHKTRIEVAWKWALTSKKLFMVSVEKVLTEFSPVPDVVYPGCSFVVLGCTLYC